MTNKFVHLHVHTEYSLLDGLSKIENMLEHIKKKGMDSIAITDHGVMYGVVEFYKQCHKLEVKPVIGIEAYISNVNHKEKPERGKIKNHHLILLAKNNKGYENLMKITSIAHLEGYYYRPRIDKKTLKLLSEGLICLSGCPKGELGSLLIDGQIDKAKETAGWFADVFNENYYLEIQRHEYSKHALTAENDSIKSELLIQSENQEIITKGVMEISRSLGIPVVATNDAHYIKKQDAIAQDALVCIATGKVVSDTKRLRFIDSPSFYLKSPKEMYELFSDIPEALENTTKISNKCNVTLDLDKWFFPEYELKKGKTSDEQLKDAVYDGISKKISKITKEIKKRIEYELQIIKEKKYSTYFLIVADMAKFCEKESIITNTRGSTAGSLVAYALDIISINPLKYDLPFERFLTPWRPSPPDIDFDIADNRREEIINYITKKYKKERVAQICTFGRMLARGSVRDIARVLGYPYATGDRISKSIPLGSQGFPMSIRKALKISDDLKILYKNDQDSKKILDLAQQVEGNARHISVHAAGIVIAPDEITKYTPVQLDPEGRKVITQYDMEALDPNVSPKEAIGLLKFDLLGLRNLSILGSAVEIVKAIKGIDIILKTIPLNDKNTYDMLTRGDTMGVFQLSGSGMTRYLKELKPNSIEDLMAMVALYRPGPMAKLPEYIDRKNNPSKVEFTDPRMKEYLGKSYGLIIYQDDVFATAIKLAGYSWEEADKFRKAVGKKIPKEMEKQKNKFIDGAVKNGMERKKAEELFQLIEPFSGYGFNKAHAASYGMVAYQTAYMKANYPVEFMCAFLTAESNDKDKISAAVHECKRMGIEILPPDINESRIGFTVVNYKSSLEGKGIRFGLSAIKNVGKAAIEAILIERKKGNFKSFPDFLTRVDNRKVNKKVLESLIKVGALSKYGKRALLISIMDDVRSKLVKSRSDKNQQGLFSDDEIETGVKHDLIENEHLDEFDDEELQLFERQLLGFSLSAKPISDILEPFYNKVSHKIYEISANEDLDRRVAIAGVVSDIKIVITKRSGQEMAFVRVEDGTGTIDLVVFPKIFQKTKDNLIDSNPILILGRVDNKDEQPAIIVEDILNKEKVGSDDMFYIKIPPGTDAEKLRILKNILFEYPGDQSVCLVFESLENRQVVLSIRVNWSKQLSRQISNLFE